MGREFHYLIVMLFITLLSGGCGELTPPVKYKEQSGTYLVHPGDTLYSIAWEAGLDYREVAAWNNIPPPYLIHPGQRLTMTSPKPQPVASASSYSTNKAPHAKSPLPPKKPLIKKPASVHETNTKPHHSKTPHSVGKKKKSPEREVPPIEKEDSAPKSLLNTWRWPTEGKVVAKYDPSTGKKGIDISGRNGQSIFSAGSGDVVYSGSGLLGYGNLIIIKHDDVFLSAYGHNSQLLVKEGDKVAAGQEIAKMGMSPKEGAMLHFEIRKEGKPVDPSTYLPKKN